VEWRYGSIIPTYQVGPSGNVSDFARGLSPLGLATIFYCLRSETSLIVASYYSQGHGGGIRPHSTRVYMKSESESESESDVTTDSQSASLSWNKAPSGAYDQIFISI
jgi:hypothetical protein